MTYDPKELLADKALILNADEKQMFEKLAKHLFDFPNDGQYTTLRLSGDVPALLALIIQTGLVSLAEK